jgi:hypothetical protein
MPTEIFYIYNKINKLIRIKNILRFNILDEIQNIELRGGGSLFEGFFFILKGWFFEDFSRWELGKNDDERLGVNSIKIFIFQLSLK